VVGIEHLSPVITFGWLQLNLDLY